MSLSVSPRFWRLPLALVAGSLPLMLALASGGRSAPTAPIAAETPQQVANTLDSIVQPRFQQDAGRFGVDRIFELDGHGNVQWVDADSHAERQRFAAVKASKRPYIIAFLHCRHKPEHVAFTAPKIDALTAVGATQTGAERMYEWADKSLTPACPAALGGA